MKTRHKKLKLQLLSRLQNPLFGLSYSFVTGSAVLASVMCLVSSQANATPTNGQVSAGQATISQPSNAQLNINQVSQRAIINWDSFSVAGGEKVLVSQPNSSSALLNRITGSKASEIFGSITANGQVFLSNPSGVVFAPGSKVDVGGLVATSLNISDENFMAGNLKFTASGGAGQVSNAGTIQAGFAALMGTTVENTGVITTFKGSTALAAGDAVTLDFDPSGMLAITVDKSAYQAQVLNSGVIEADGGQVFMSASAADALLRTVVNNTGIVRARSITERNGEIIIDGGNFGVTQISGNLDASGKTSGLKGGTVQVLGQNVALGDNAKINASGDVGGGTVLVGGDYQGTNLAVRNSSAVVIAATALINADAINSGNGGKVILWSDAYTNFLGQITAKGGAMSGDGGFIETSSHDNLQAFGSVDASSTTGLAGSWMLDPRNVTIDSSATGSLSSGTFSAASDNAVIGASVLVTALNGGTNVTVNTGPSGSQSGDITVDSPIAKTGGSVSTLTLSAANDINVNAAITSASSRLNVVLTADSDASGSGSVNFASTGMVTTYGGNFYVGAMSGNSVTKKGQNYTMLSGSSIDVAGGMIDIKVNGTLTLTDNSLKLTNNTYPNYNDGSTKYYYNQLSLTAATIATNNTSAATPDIIDPVVYTYLTAGTIGSSATPIKFSGGSTNSNQLYVTNSTGSSYVDQVGYKAFGNISVTIGTQANSTQSLKILGDSSSTNHILMNTDASGVLKLASGDINTAGSSSSVTISSPQITFANTSVNVGSGSFTASGNISLTSSQVDDSGDISGYTISLSSPSVGTLAAPIEVGSGTNLSVSNSGGSSYVKSVTSATQFPNLTISAYKTAGTNSILFVGGDHVNFSSDGTKTYIPTISGGASDGKTFGVTNGIDVSHNSHNITIIANSGDLVFANTSINTNSGKFTGQITYSNTGVIAAETAYNSSSPVAQITAGDVEFDIYNGNNPTTNTIGAVGKDIQISQGTNASNNTLTVTTYQGNVNIHELTANHFKTLKFYLNNTSLAQTIAVDLNGADDINFSDNGSQITLDDTKVNLAANNRNFLLQASSRSIEIDSVKLGTGYYDVYAGSHLKLNSDVATNDGYIKLVGNSGIDLMTSVTVDSNSDNLGYSGYIYMTGTLSGTGSSRTLTVDSSSSNNSANYIQFYSGASNSAGSYLSGISLTAKGSTNTNDNTVYLLGNSYLINGDFTSIGSTTIYYNTTIDTEQGNTANAGNITFGGYNAGMASTSYSLTLDASTTAAGKNGGTVDLYNTYNHGILSPANITVNSTGGSGGSSGTISLPGISTVSNGQTNTQSYTGGIINLYGNLSSDKGAITLAGDTRLQNSIAIDTWSPTYNTSYPSYVVQNGTAGAVTISGVGISASVAGKTLSIDTTTDTGTAYSNQPTNTLSFSQSAGNVSIVAGNAGGNYIGGLTVNTGVAGDHNTGTAGAITLNTVGTEGAQSYSGGAMTVSGAISSNGGNINFASVSSLALSGTTVSFDTDRTGGTNNAGTLNFASFVLNSAAGSNTAVTIDTTADGGGLGTDFTLNNAGATKALSSLDLAARNVTVSGGTGVKALGAITIEARGATSDLTLNAPVSSTNGNIILAAGRNFINNNAANTGIAPGSGRYFVYSADPSSSTEGMTGYKKHYSQSYVSGSTPAYATTGNYFFYSIAPTITISSSTTSIAYGAADPTLTSSLSGFVDGDTSSDLSGSPTLTLASYTASSAGKRPAGTYAITLSGSLSDNLGYQYADFTSSLVVNPKSLAVSGLSATNRVYDAGTSATLSGTATVPSALTGDVVSVSGTVTGSFADKNVGTAKAITVSGLTLGGADSANYTLTQQAGLTADITKATLTVSGLTASNKVYNANNTTVLGGTATVTALGSDIVNTGGTASGTFANKNIGTAKPVTVTGVTISGADAGNYTLVQQSGLTADITKANLAVSGLTVSNKTYDTNTSATLGGTAVISPFGSDDVTLGGTASGTFSDKTVGTAKTVTVTGNTISGVDIGNYTLVQQTGLTADITKANLTVSGLTASNKVYNANTAATLGGTATITALGSDIVTLGGTASGNFATKTVGTAKPIAVTGNTISGADAANYNLVQQTGLTADITKATLNVSGLTVGNKIYDTTVAATLGGTAAITPLGSDTVTLGGTAAGTFADKNVGTAKVVTVTGNTISGADADNYTLAQQAGLTADITKANLAVTGLSASNKVYNANVTATLTGTAAIAPLGTDVVSLGGTGVGAFNNKNVGNAKTVTVSGYTLSGADSANYALVAPSTLTANITPASLSASGTVQNKVYDSTTTATFSNVSLSGQMAGDSLSVSATASFSDKNTGTGKSVSAVYALSGADSTNYTFSPTTSYTADISKAALSAHGSAESKVYDGTTVATLAGLGLNGVLGSDTVAVKGTASFSQKDVGKSIPVSASLSLSGSDANNYEVPTLTNLKADITKAGLLLTVNGAVAQNKVYDGSTAAIISGATLSGVFTGDSVSVTGGGTFADKNVGIGKSVTADLALAGASADNYSILQPKGLTADITPATITVNGAVAQNKVYDGTTAATISGATLSGVVTGDSVTVASSGSFADKNQGKAKSVSFAVTLGGADSSNYKVGALSSLSADITAKSLTLSGVSITSKVYDGTTTATVSSVGTLTGVIAADAGKVTVNGGSAAFADKNAGTAKAVTFTGFSLVGTESGNYSLADSGINTTGDITRRPVSVAADPKSKNEGVTDPTFTFTTGSTSTSSGLVTGDTLTGSLSRDTGEAAGIYPIRIGTLTNSSNPNYDINFSSADLTINATIVPQIPIVTPPVTPAITPTTPTTPAAPVVTAPVITTPVTVAPVVTAPATTISGGFVEAKPIPEVFTHSSSIQVRVSADLFIHENPQAVINIDVKQVDGSPLPTWLRYDPEKQMLVGEAPAGSSGEMKFVIIAKDQFGGEARSELTLNLDQKN